MYIVAVQIMEVTDPQTCNITVYSMHRDKHRAQLAAMDLARDLMTSYGADYDDPDMSSKWTVFWNISRTEHRYVAAHDDYRYVVTVCQHTGND